MSASAYECSHPIGASSPFAAFFGYSHFDYDDRPNYDFPKTQIRRTDEEYPWMYDTPSQRSIPVSSNVQRTQTQDRRRIGPSQRMGEEPTVRSQNGSFKIINKFSPTFAESRKGKWNMFDHRIDMFDLDSFIVSSRSTPGVRRI